MNSIKMMNSSENFWYNFKGQISYMSLGNASVCGKRLGRNSFYLTYKDTSLFSSVRNRILLIGHLKPEDERIDYFRLWGFLDPVSIVLLYGLCVFILLASASFLGFPWILLAAAAFTFVFTIITYICAKLDTRLLEYEVEILKTLNFLNTAPAEGRLDS